MALLERRKRMIKSLSLINIKPKPKINLEDLFSKKNREELIRKQHNL